METIYAAYMNGILTYNIADDIPENKIVWFGEGMYKVGVDIPAGEYYLECTSDYSAYECVYNNSYSNRDIKTNDNFKNNKYITVYDGDYLLLSRCVGKIVE